MCIGSWPVGDGRNPNACLASLCRTGPKICARLSDNLPALLEICWRNIPVLRTLNLDKMCVCAKCFNGLLEEVIEKKNKQNNYMEQSSII